MLYGQLKSNMEKGYLITVVKLHVTVFKDHLPA